MMLDVKRKVAPELGKWGMRWKYFFMAMILLVMPFQWHQMACSKVLFSVLKAMDQDFFRKLNSDGTGLIAKSKYHNIWIFKMDEDMNALTWGMFIFEELLYDYKECKQFSEVQRRSYKITPNSTPLVSCLPTPVFLPGESQGWRSLVGCRLWGGTESDTTEAT